MRKRPFFLTILLFGMLIFSQCSETLEPSPPIFLISPQKNEFSTQNTSNCVFRYKIVSPYTQLDNDTQSKAVTDGFMLWQKVNNRLTFIQFSVEERCEIWVKFTEPEKLQTTELTNQEGLIKFPLIGQSISKKENGRFVIYLSNVFRWTKESLTKAIAYHTGLMLGVATSKNTASAMYPYGVNEKVVIDKTDSIEINRLYPFICKDADFSFLPITSKLNNYKLFKIRLEKQGIIKIVSSGQIRVGIWLGYSSPDGLDKGLFNFPIGGYNIYPELNHAAIIYKKNNETVWRLCGSYREITTDGNEYLELELDLNDKDKTDNIGAYDVVISYK